MVFAVDELGIRSLQGGYVSIIICPLGIGSCACSSSKISY
jgi:hypothetical protein